MSALQLLHYVLLGVGVVVLVCLAIFERRRHLDPELLRSYDEKVRRQVKRSLWRPSGSEELVGAVSQDDLRSVLRVRDSHLRVVVVVALVLFSVAGSSALLQTERVQLLQKVLEQQLSLQKSLIDILRETRSSEGNGPVELEPAYTRGEVEGLRVRQLSQTGRLARAGLREGDVIVRLGDEPLTSMRAVDDAAELLLNPAGPLLEVEVKTLAGEVRRIRVP